MENELIKHLSKYVEITKELEEAIVESAFIKNYRKGTILLKEGDFSNECYFIIKGCIRSYYLKDGEEKTTEFYTEEQVISPSFYGKKFHQNITWNASKKQSPVLALLHWKQKCIKSIHN